MKSSIFALSVLACAANANVLKRAGCNADNCERAILGTQAGAARQSSRLADCSSYFAVTVTPAPSTVSTAVATSYLFSQVSSTYASASTTAAASGTAITRSPSSIPDYASTACSGNTTPAAVRYSSACSCGGVTKSTTTVSATTVTVPYTTTKTVSSFLIAATGAPLTGVEYLELSGDIYGYENSNTLGFTTTEGNATPFVINQNQLEILSGGILSNDDQTAVTEPLFFDTNSTITTSGYAPVDVTITQTLALTLRNTFNGDSITEDCGGLLDVGPVAGGTDVLGNSCTVVTLSAIVL